MIISFFSAMVFFIKSDIDYAETTKRVLFSLNNLDEINVTEDVQITRNCFIREAYFRVRTVLIS